MLFLLIVKNEMTIRHKNIEYKMMHIIEINVINKFIKKHKEWSIYWESIDELIFKISLKNMVNEKTIKKDNINFFEIHASNLYE